MPPLRICECDIDTVFHCLVPSLGGTPISHNQDGSIVHDFDAAFDIIDIVIVTCHLLVVTPFRITSTPVMVEPGQSKQDHSLVQEQKQY